MLELVIVACLLSSPEHCEERVVLYDAQVGLHTCMMSAQPELARWTAAHPAFRVSRWACRVRDVNAAVDL